MLLERRLRPTALYVYHGIHVVLYVCVAWFLAYTAARPTDQWSVMRERERERREKDGECRAASVWKTKTKTCDAIDVN